MRKKNKMRPFITFWNLTRGINDCSIREEWAHFVKHFCKYFNLMKSMLSYNWWLLKFNFINFGPIDSFLTLKALQPPKFRKWNSRFRGLLHFLYLNQHLSIVILATKRPLFSSKFLSTVGFQLIFHCSPIASIMQQKKVYKKTAPLYLIG